MAAIHLNATEEALFIILAVLLCIIVVSLLVILYQKRSYFTRQRDQHVWHDFIMIDSPDHMIALKNSESMSFDSRRRRSSTPMFNHHHQQQANYNMSNHQLVTTHTDLIAQYNSTTSATLPQSPAAVYHHNP
ncbi:hypothetical protein MUCCIDRAFT_107538 [Mucor lusitanicus CBS 277.49]|uniref:Uncharacterized protein n=1 Tax=Mucor lusitanicus CBS 277.49 TaxID=747725 RepID=A0A168NZB7_MUCCL|nr:hypothetical protein MUCCIDRAFT_107538 [Mucor lusitanicus CBS 277.49]